MQFQRFNKKEVYLLQYLSDARMSDVFFQPTRDFVGNNLLVLNFMTSEQSLLSLNVGCFVRIKRKNRILFTSSDEFFASNYEHLEEESEDNLLKKNISNLILQLLDVKVKSIKISETADLIIQMNNGIVIEVIVDCLGNHYEHYRIINHKTKEHQTVCSYQGNIYCETLH